MSERADHALPGRKPLSLRAHIVAIVVAALVPALAVGGAAVWVAVNSYRTAFEARLHDTARALALGIDAEINILRGAMLTLAGSSALNGAAPDLDTFEMEARHAAASLGTVVVLIEPTSMRQMINTALRPGQDPGALARADYQSVVETRRPMVSSLGMGAVSRRLVAGVAVLEERAGRVLYILLARLDPDHLSRLLATQAIGGGFATLMDGNDVVVARSRDHDRFIGQKLLPWMVEAMQGGDAETTLLRGPNRLGQVSISAYHHLAGAAGWYIVRGEPIGVYKAAIWKPIRALANGGLVVLLLALVAAYLISRRILLPMRTLTRQAEATAASGGEAVLAQRHSSGVAEFEHLSQAVQLADATLRAKAAEVADAEARLRAVVDTAMDAIVVIDNAGIVQSFNRAAEAIFGYIAEEATGRNASFLMACGHAGRHDSYLAGSLRSGCQRMVGTRREVEGRRKDGTTVPIDISVAEWRDARGRRFFTGIMRDISGRKADEARRVLLMREVDHRAKNVLAVVQSVLRLTPREEPHAFVAAVEARVTALARAHSLLADAGWSGADLRAVAECELAPYGLTRDTAAARGATVLLDGPPIPLAAAAVQPLAMVLHELATNAAKYGALSVPGGTVEVRWHASPWTQEDGSLHLRWIETGGPAISGPPTRRGFGTRIIGTTVRGQLGGTAEFGWEPTGLVCEITTPLARVAECKGAAAG